MSKKSITMYPYRHVDFSRKYHDVHKIKDYVGFVCPECYNYGIYRASITVNIKSIDDVEESEVFVKPVYGIKCPKCGKFTYYDSALDPNITPMIAELNRKGYHTKYSSEGHKINQDSHSMPYIVFKDYRLRSICNIYPLPDPWYLEGSDKDPYKDEEYNILGYENDTLKVYDPEKNFVIRCSNLDVPIRERMAILRRWVRVLPEVFDGEFYYPKEETIDELDMDYLTKPLEEEEITERKHDRNDSLSIEYDEEDDDYHNAIKSVIDRHSKNTYERQIPYEDDIEWQYSTVEEIKHRNDPNWDPEEEKRKRLAKAEEIRRNTKKYKREQAAKRRAYDDNKSSNFYNPAFETEMKKSRPSISNGVKPYYMNKTANSPSDNTEKKERTFSPNYKGSKYKKNKKASKQSQPVKPETHRKYKRPNSNN